MASDSYRVGVAAIALALVLAAGPAAAMGASTEKRPNAQQSTDFAAASQSTAATSPTAADRAVRQDDETNQSLTAEDILRQAEAAYREYDGFTALQNTTASVDGNRTNTTARLFYEKPNRLRLEYLGPSPQAGTILVSNGSQTLLYNATNNTVQRFDQPRLAGAAGGFFDSVVRSLRAANTTYRGTETVEGRETYVLEARSPERPGPNVTQTYYLDAETYFPVKQTAEVTLTMDGETVETDTTTVFSDVTLNPDLPADTFDFDPPAGATVAETPFAVETYESVAEARETVGIRIREPRELPAGYEFNRTAVFRFGNASNVILSYANETGAALTVTQTNRSGSANATGTVGFGEQISFDGRTATLASFGTERLLVFDCGDQQITVSGPLNRSELVRVAASIPCDGAPDQRVFDAAVSFDRGGLRVSVGPPRDLDGDGTYEDVNGDGSVGALDAAAHALVVSAVEADALSLTDAQRDALDIDGDGNLDYDDALALLAEG